MMRSTSQQMVQRAGRVLLGLMGGLFVRGVVLCQICFIRPPCSDKAGASARFRRRRW